MSDAVIAKLQALLGEKGFIPAEAVGDWKPSPLGPTHARQAACVVRPASADEAAAVLKLCHEAKQAVVVGGGFTGLVHATDTSETEILMSMERMTAIREIDPIGRTMIAEAGVPIQTVQEAAEREGLFYPVDWGARGSATVGGSLATNAGGNRVIRWGMTRDSVLGAEVALTDGTVLHNLNTLVKNNAGYDLKNLFVGSEGTLGVITAASLRLREKPQSHNAAFAAVPSFEALTAFLKHMDRALGGTLSAFEVMWREAYEVLTATPNTQPPLPQGSPFTVLTEAMGGHQQADKERFEAALEQALEDGLITDAAVAQSAREITAFWSVRDSVLNFGQHWPIFTFDVSLPIRTMKDYLSNLKPALETRFKDTRLFVFGHLGDGNLHLIVAPGDGSAEARRTVEEMVYTPLKAINGSVSAEHGIGIEKRDFLPLSRTAPEISVMRAMKQVFDPNNILNPGRVLGGA